MSDIPYDHTTAPKPDIRPTRLGLDALLAGPTLTHGVRRAVIDALEDAGLLNGGRPADSAPAADASGRLSIALPVDELCSQDGLEMDGRMTQRRLP